MLKAFKMEDDWSTQWRKASVPGRHQGSNPMSRQAWLGTVSHCAVHSWWQHTCAFPARCDDSNLRLVNLSTLPYGLNFCKETEPQAHQPRCPSCSVHSLIATVTGGGYHKVADLQLANRLASPRINLHEVAIPVLWPLAASLAACK